MVRVAKYTEGMERSPILEHPESNKFAAGASTYFPISRDDPEVRIPRVDDQEKQPRSLAKHSWPRTAEGRQKKKEKKK